jgi:hypothetical protein
MHAKHLSLTKPNQKQGRGVGQRAFSTKGLCMAVLNGPVGVITKTNTVERPRVSNIVDLVRGGPL